MGFHGFLTGLYKAEKHYDDFWYGGWNQLYKSVFMKSFTLNPKRTVVALVALLFSATAVKATLPLLHQKQRLLPELQSVPR
jgi:hypothetical protein